ncbi:hypothetical protein RIF29_08064 [Crotalaria pallida]|uniref:Uncharacterized protein n=1 Tax=Crotalaria pallida TaxID=3830 RepID=A0AAN9J609_CROPI
MFLHALLFLNNGTTPFQFDAYAAVFPLIQRELNFRVRYRLRLELVNLVEIFYVKANVDNIRTMFSMDVTIYVGDLLIGLYCVPFSACQCHDLCFCNGTHGGTLYLSSFPCCLIALISGCIETEQT